jgi:hypothetical protein
MRRRHASSNDVVISDAEGKFRWPPGRRPDDHRGLNDLSLKCRGTRRDGGACPDDQYSGKNMNVPYTLSFQTWIAVGPV